MSSMAASNPTNASMNKPIWHCRRTLVAAYTVTLLFVLGVLGKEPVAGAMAAVVLAVAGANAGESILTRRNQDAQDSPPTPPPCP